MAVETQDYFSGLGTPINGKYRARNMEIRGFLKKNPRYTKTTKRGKRLRKELATNRAKANPVDPETGLRVRSLDAGARSAARQKYGSTRASMTSQIGTVETQLKNLDPYFGQYEKHLADLGTEAANRAAAQAAQINQTQAAANQTAASAQQQIAGRAADPSAAQEGLQAAESAAAGRTALANQSAAAAAERGEARKGMFDAMKANTGLAKNETRTAIQSNLKQMLSQRNQLDQEIGDYFNQHREQVKGSYLDNLLKREAAKLAGAKFDLQAADIAADNARADANLANTVSNTEADNIRADEQASESGGGSTTPAYTKSKRIEWRDNGGKWNRRLARTGVNSRGEIRVGTSKDNPAGEVYKVAKFNGDVKAIRKAEKALTGYIQGASGLPAYLSAAIAQQKMYGMITPTTAKRLRKQTGNPPATWGFKVGNPPGLNGKYAKNHKNRSRRYR